MAHLPEGHLRVIQARTLNWSFHVKPRTPDFRTLAQRRSEPVGGPSCTGPWFFRAENAAGSATEGFFAPSVSCRRRPSKGPLPNALLLMIGLLHDFRYQNPSDYGSVVYISQHYG